MDFVRCASYGGRTAISRCLSWTRVGRDTAPAARDEIRGDALRPASKPAHRGGGDAAATKVRAPSPSAVPACRAPASRSAAARSANGGALPRCPACDGIAPMRVSCVRAHALTQACPCGRPGRPGAKRRRCARGKSRRNVRCVARALRGASAARGVACRARESEFYTGALTRLGAGCGAS